MGCVGVNGKWKLSDGHKGCILFMDMEGDVAVYNNGFCLFPLVGAAVIAGLTLIFFIIWSIIISRREEVSAKAISITFMIFAIAMALLSFAICAEIGIGLNKGCKILLEDQRHHCRRKKFNALWASEICSGISSGLLIIALVLELFQFMLPAHYSSRVGVAVNSRDYKATAPNSTVNSPRIEADQPQIIHQHLNQGQPQTIHQQLGQPQPQMTSPRQLSQHQFSQPPSNQYYYQPQELHQPYPAQNMPAAPGTPVVDTLPTANSPTVHM
ncbi:hypothetical protein BGX26_001654 [Mortierella sp. AD094]|nr:hypothetical protein BGX26_001654 [Mortierella sp. AD094]